MFMGMGLRGRDRGWEEGYVADFGMECPFLDSGVVVSWRNLHR